MVEVSRWDAATMRARLDNLAEVLHDSVAGGASVGFLWPFTREEARAFFEGLVPSVEDGSRILLVATDGGRVVGTVQANLRMPPNQPRRGEIAKLLVHREARGKGVGALLMERVEREAAAAGKTLLVLDTVTGGDAERLYARLGWQRTGVIPDFALMPGGEYCDTTVFWKSL